jgi:hypothetical protein
MRTIVPIITALLASAGAAQDACPPWEAVPSPNLFNSTHTVVRGLTAIADDHVRAVDASDPNNISDGTSETHPHSERCT